VTALIVSRGDRGRHLRALGVGAAAAAAALAALLAVFGLVGAFARTTFSFLPSLLPVYAQGFPMLPIAPGEVMEKPLIPMPYLYGLVALAIILLGAKLPEGGRISDEARGALPVLAWVVLSMLSVVERRHVGYTSMMIPAALILLARWFCAPGRARLIRILAASAALVAVAMPHPAAGLLLSATRMIQFPAAPTDIDPIASPPRARGALFRRHDRTLIRKTSEMMQRAGFRDGDTWLDFANEPGLYFLFDRPCPIRYYEPGFYESEGAQQEVIDAVAGNLRVRAVLMRGTYPPVDGIENSIRAPKVDRYIREHFHPFLVEDGVEYWIRQPQDAK